MAVAMLRPEPKKLKRKQNAINGDHGVAHQRIADACAVPDPRRTARTGAVQSGTDEGETQLGSAAA